MHETYKESREATINLIAACNTLSHESQVRDGVREAFRNSHRTLQQGFVRNVIVSVLEELEEMRKNGKYDLRNEDAIEFAEKALEVNKDTYLRLV